MSGSKKAGVADAIAAVRTFYDAVGRGDVAGVVASLHPELEWTEAQRFPYYSGTWRSPQEVVERLLVPLRRDWTDFSATPDEFVVQGDRVVTLGHYAGTARETGRTMRAPFAHVWTVRDGRLARFDMYTDTALVLEALRP